MKPIELPPLNDAAIQELDTLYHTTRDTRVRTHAQMILLAAEQRLTAPQIRRIVRKDQYTVRRWMKRYQAEGLAGLSDAPRVGGTPRLTPGYCERLVQRVRQRPCALGYPFSLWTCQRLADVLAEETGIRVDAETVRRRLAATIVLSRPQHTISSPDVEYQVKKGN
jgi:transposase